MKTIGMIGGMSWESSAIYYRAVNEETHRLLGGQHNARSILFTVDFADIEAHQVAGRWDEAAAMLCDAARSLAGAGAEILILCTNTMHKVASEIADATGATFIHIADPTADAVRTCGIQTVGLLGTRYTMEEDFYRRRLESKGLKVLIPQRAERDEVHGIIFDELCHGLITDSSRARYREIVRSLQARGAEGVILGCTEIGMLLKSDDVSIPLFDTARLHAAAAVAEAIRG
ncbi:MAG TPA: aspartate/glutamate racemase family protein [Steroidobacteraceae bacterium]|nr:aspartate/glutamate racemase family protein [Steroidobacteraceae bacterium]